MTTQQEGAKQNTPNNKRLLTGIILVGILLLGLILRILYLREIANDPGFRFPQMDAGFHDYWARGLATGDWTVTESCYDFKDPEIRTSPYFRPPSFARGAFLGLFALVRANILLFGPVVLGWF